MVGKISFYDGEEELKHEFGSANKLFNQMVLAMTENKLTETMREKLQSSITYFNNHLWQMDYAQFQQKTYPIDSGVTEAACKTLIKQRLYYLFRHISKTKN